MRAAFFSAALAVAVSLPAAAEPFNEDFALNLERYAGLWYETARTPNEFEDNTPRRQGEVFSPCFNATAAYTVQTESRLTLRNRCKREAPSGRVIEDTITGVIQVQEGSAGRKAKITFGSGVARFFQRAFADGGFDYWIYCVSPVAGEGPYDWAVVSGEEKDFLFFLTRDQFVSEETLAAMRSCARTHALPVDELIYPQRAE